MKVTKKSVLAYINIFYFVYLSLVLLSVYTLYNHLIVYSLFPVTLTILLFKEFYSIIMMSDEDIDALIKEINRNE